MPGTEELEDDLDDLNQGEDGDLEDLGFLV
jgi:hypothetical protein